METKILRNALFALAAVVAATLASCGDDELTGSGNDYSYKSTSHYRLDYSVDLADEDVLDVADLIVEYLDSLGNKCRDTVTSSSWTRTVNFARAAQINCALTAQYSAKDNATMNKSEYDFDVDLASPTYRVYSDGSVLFYGQIHANGYSGALGHDDEKSSSTTLTAAYLATQYGRNRVDSTSAHFDVTLHLSGSTLDSVTVNR